MTYDSNVSFSENTLPYMMVANEGAIKKLYVYVIKVFIEMIQIWHLNNTEAIFRYMT